MKYVLFGLACALVFTGCDAMSGKEIRYKIDQCAEENLSYVVRYNGLTNQIRDIECEPYDVKNHLLWRYEYQTK